MNKMSGLHIHFPHGITLTGDMAAFSDVGAICSEPSCRRQVSFVLVKPSNLQATFVYSPWNQQLAIEISFGIWDGLFSGGMPLSQQQ